MEPKTEALRLKLVTPPAVEPLNLESDVKTHLRIDVDTENYYITTLMEAARRTVELMAGRALINQTYRLDLDNWPGNGEIELPYPPLSSVTSISYTDTDGNTSTWSSDDYDVDTDSEPGRVVLGDGKTFPTSTLAALNPVKVTYVAGYGAAGDSVPQHFKQAILLLIAQWYENRENIIVGSTVKELPMAVKQLIYMDRVL